MRTVRNLGPRTRAGAVVLALLALAGTGTAARSGGAVPLAGAPDQAAADVLHVAKNQMGDPYVWGGNGPNGWDCSGLTSLWRSVGGATSMPRVSRDQQAWAIPLPRSQALPGDLVFFGHPVTHVGLYAGAGRMVDAARSLGGVVERSIWTAGVVRYGRVPRPGMVRVQPWTPAPLPPLPSGSPAPAPDDPASAPDRSPTPSAKPMPSAKPTPKPTPSAKPTPKPSAKPTPATSAPRPALAPLRGLPGVQASPSSTTALQAAKTARSVLGSPNWNDVSLVRVAWRHAGGGTLPSSRAALVAQAKPVLLADARVGDLVVYDGPAGHLGIYLGHGYMIDASVTHGRVVVRRVYDAPSVRLVRLG